MCTDWWREGKGWLEGSTGGLAYKLGVRKEGEPGAGREQTFFILHAFFDFLDFFFDSRVFSDLP